MDDLAGLDWSSTSMSNPPPANNPPPSFYPPLRQSPAPQLSGRSTPLSAQQSGSVPNSRGLKPPSKPATPANDSFSSLLSLNSKPTNNLSLQERQRQLQEEKVRQEAERKKQYDKQFGAHDAQFWDTLGNGNAAPPPSKSPVGHGNVSGNTLSATINKPFAGLDTSKRSSPFSAVDDDLLSAFNSAAPVDASTNFPKPGLSGRSTPATHTPKTHTALPEYQGNSFLGDDDDPFGLAQYPQRPSNAVPQVTVENDDDILGALGKPVSEFTPAKRVEPRTRIPVETQQEPESDTGFNDPRDKAIAELVDMGFPPDKSAHALEQTESGTDVQAAVGWLLTQAHNEAKQKSQSGRDGRGRTPLEDNEDQPRTTSRSNGRSVATANPPWMRGQDDRSNSSQRRQDNKSPGGEKDVTQYASEIGTTLFKSANSLWKTSQKKVQKAVAEFQQEGDSSQPKWMRDAQLAAEQEARPSPRSREKAPEPESNVTDEALLLESGISRPQRAQRQPASSTQLPSSKRDIRPNEFALPERPSSQPRIPPQRPQHFDKRPTEKLTRQAVEEQAAQAYVSPARRKRPTTDTKPAETPSSSNSSRQPTPLESRNPFAQRTATPVSKSPSVTPLPTRPKPPPRRIPPASSSALSSSASDRKKGSEAFKRGDYHAAHIAYSAALSPLPETHPVAIIVFCNRALVNIKVGDPKAAIADADNALVTIGPSRGENEKISLGGIEGDKDMKEFFGKALMRKAEALEHMEKWADAGKVWKEAVEAGVGGAISIQGRNRCERAAGGANKPATPKPAPVRKPHRKKSALADLAGVPAGSESEAVKKLKEANAAADKADDEKFALTDQVDAKLIMWKGTKSDNLRALLGSLDNVLWAEAGWKKVGMGDLVMPNKVKIAYMKAIAKVHPDKIPQNATTEQRMISAAVFSTLNEAWDKFKKDNGL
ncbi:uncharacterized protein BDZ99DRAFT_434115 [Mytilinidion resinicola]|uniref:UBA domain-containing protein n=1 Tax=Mytilinidion resinicola TaxID=574789 RepID=A0A6A6Z766_9PEZI|nr:uncharacterized protein BDZ99DRAFT_434115 [Mytilinidion resinicola]KAF2816658.1 hypothetical protein BDZ99DRAFT_434115 [Mytilinidion resinicola]